VDQQKFESEVMQDLAAEAPPSSADDPLDEASNTEGYEEDAMEDAAVEEMDMFEEGGEESFHAEDAFADGFEENLGEGYAEEDIAAWEALEDAMADALEAYDTDEFLGRALGGISQVAGLINRGVGAAGQATRTVSRVAHRTRRATGQAQRVAGRVGRIAGRAARARSPLGYLMQRFGQYLNEGFDEFEALEDLADTFAEEELDEFLPVLAGLAARALARPSVRRAAGQLTRPLRRRLVRGATQATQALRALPRIAQSVARISARRRLQPGALPAAFRQIAAQVAAHPQLAQRLAQPASLPPTSAMRRRRPVSRGISRSSM
jgi:ABC-type transporter Mla subunit MlaD